MKEQRRQPHLITEETEAREEYWKLTNPNVLRFEVRSRGVGLSVEAFADALRRNDPNLSIRRIREIHETIEPQELNNIINSLIRAKNNPQKVYDELLSQHLEPYLQGEILSEDQFVDLAKVNGAVDLVRIRKNIKGEPMIVRYFGTKIGSSNTRMYVMPVPSNSNQIH